jgi:outer membrane protein assembly factor BamB
MSAIDLINHLERTGDLSRKMAEKLRKQVLNVGKPISARKVAKQLVKNGVIDEARAKAALNALSPAKRRDDDLELLPDTDESLEMVKIVDTLPPRANTVSTSPTRAELPVAMPVEIEVEPSKAEHAVTDAIEHVEQAEQSAPAVSTRRKRRRYTGQRWDSPLMLVGGGSLVLLLIVGAALWFWLARGTADEAYKLADDEYRAENYAQAAGKFQSFAHDYPDNEKASLALVRAALSQILAEVSKKNWHQAYQTLRAELPRIESEARPELASILPNIMRGFAELAEQADDLKTAEQQFQHAQDTLREINNSSYLPTRFRTDLQPRLDSIDAILKTVERRINRDKDLESRLREIDSAIEQVNTAAAFTIHRELLRQYPELEARPELRQAVERIVMKDRERVTSADQVPTPAADDHPRSARASVVLASRRGSSIPLSDGTTLFMLARGSVYGIRASNGEVLWRRCVGFDTTVAPVPLSQEAAADVLVVDSRHHELMRLNGASGQLVWRLTCPGPIAQPVLDKNLALVSCDAGATGVMLAVDVDTGNVVRSAKFPMPLNSPVARDPQGPAIYQPGTHSSVFVLDAETFTCRDAIYLGHGSGSIVVPPAILMNHVLVAENPAPSFSLLHVLGPDPEHDGQLKPMMKPKRLDGQVVVPMIVFGKRVLVTTERGGLEVFELDSRNPESPLSQVVEGVAGSSDKSTISQSHAEEGQLWLADHQLVRFDLQASRRALVRKWIRDKGDIFQGPMRRIGDYLVHTRQRQGKLGVTVAAFAMNSDGQPIWETDLGVPPAGEVFPNVAKQRVGVLSANGELYWLGRTELQAGMIDKPHGRALDADLPILDHTIDLGNERFVAFDVDQPNTYVYHDPTAAIPLRKIAFGLGTDRVTTGPIAFGDKLLVMTATASVHVIDPATGLPAVHEFQPTLTAGSEDAWPRGVFSSTDRQAILSDGKRRLFKLALEPGTPPKLVAAAQADSEIKPAGQLARSGDTVFAIQHVSPADEIVAFRATDLTSLADRWPLNGRCVWGPETIGDVVLVTSDAGDVHCLDSEGKQLWQSSLPHGALVGRPAIVKVGLAIASVDGFISILDPRSGQMKHDIELGEPLGRGPVEFGNGLVVLAADGTLHVVTIPEE